MFSRPQLVDGANEQIAPEVAEDLIDLVRAYFRELKIHN
jgi:hypothetical protein